MLDELHAPHSVIPQYDEARLATLADTHLEFLLNRRRLLIALWDSQQDWAVIPKWEKKDFDDKLALCDGDLELAVEYVIEKLEQADEAITLQKNDPFNHGYEDPSWDEIDWGIMRKRMQNYGLPIEILITGGNGGGKSFYCGNRLMRFAVGQPRSLIWVHSMDEENSKTVMQYAIAHYLPNNYKTESGRNKKDANLSLSYNVKTGFTANSFSLQNGARTQFRFWTKEIETLEGPRPWLAQSDEEIPKFWMDDITRRLITHAEATSNDRELWDRLAKQKAENPDMKFPVEHLHRLLRGVHLISFTPKKGRTEVVREFQDGAIVTRTIDAELLPIKNTDGEVIGCEKMPKEMEPKNPRRWVYFLHAWNNPLGGNWKAVKEIAKSKSRAEIGWWIYGYTEAKMGSPFPMFSGAAHVREPALIFGIKQPKSIAA